MVDTEIVIVGAGVIGLACAHELAASGYEVIVIEKHDSFGQEASSRNSEVIHAGLYYEPDSLKARFCILGNQLLYEFCQENTIPYRRLGKYLLGNTDGECERLEAIFVNAIRSGVPGVRWVSPEELREHEPHIKAQRVFFSETTGILDTHAYMNVLHNSARNKNAEFVYSAEVIGLSFSDDEYTMKVKEPDGSHTLINTQYVINAAGCMADHICEMLGINIDRLRYRLHWCKGEYFRLRDPDHFHVSHLIYPPPTDISLGIHVTPDLAGGLRLGPNAHYVQDISYTVDDCHKQAFFDSVKTFMPTITIDDLYPDTAGIRAKLQGPDETFRDFVIEDEKKHGYPGFITLLGIESPGLTASLAIARYVHTLIDGSSDIS